MLVGDGGLRPDLALEVQARQMRLLSRGLVMAGLVLLPIGAVGFLAGESLGFILGIMGIFFGGMLLIAGGATRFAAGQLEIRLAAEMAQMEEEGGYGPGPDESYPGTYARVADPGSQEPPP